MRVHALFVAVGVTFSPTVLAQQTPPAPSARSEARLLWIRGSVAVRPPGSVTTRAAVTGEVLTRGAQLRTGDGAVARVELPNGGALTLLPGSQITMFAGPTAPPPGQPASSTSTLEFGAVRASSAPASAGVLPLDIGATTVTLGRGDGTISAPRGAALVRVAVHQGRIHVRTGTSARVVRPGQGVREAFGVPRSGAFPLLGAPAWRERPVERMSTARGAGVVRGMYELPRAPGLSGWRVELARDASFHQLVSSERLPAAQTRWEGRVEGAGEYHARVSAVDAQGFEGPASAAVRFVVEMPEVVPGAPAVGSSPARQTMLRVPAGISCGVDGARLALMPHPFRFTPGRAHRVRCSADPSGADAQEFVVPASEAGPLHHDLRLRVTDGAARVIALRLSDLHGTPIPYATVAVSAGEGVSIDTMRESVERGVYCAAIRWNGARDRVQLHFTVNGDITFTEEVALSDPRRTEP